MSNVIEDNVFHQRSLPVPTKLKWLVTLVLVAGAVSAARAEDQQSYGPPEIQSPVNIRPYSQRSFRGYYLYRVVEHFRSPSVETYPKFAIDVAPSYKVDRFPCPYVYPPALYTSPASR
jgi:hypothetical protein